MVTNNLIQHAYNQLSNAFYFNRDRKAIELCCANCESLGIPNFHELVNDEMTRLYAVLGKRTNLIPSSIELLPPDVLGMYAVACMNVLFYSELNGFIQYSQLAYQTLSRPTKFHSTDVLYTQNEKRLTVGNLLKVVKYALALVDIVYPDNKLTSIANPTIWALQGIDDTLNNKSKTELTNHSLHIAADFLASSVKESLNNTNAKRSVAVSALMVNLAIDFLIK